MKSGTTKQKGFTNLLIAILQAGFMALFPSWQLAGSALVKDSSFVNSSNLFQKAALLAIIFVFFLLICLVIRKFILILLSRILTKSDQTDQNLKMLFVSSLILLIGIVVIFLVNIIFPCINTETWTFSVPNLFPPMRTIGWDYKMAFYDHAKTLIDSNFQEFYHDNNPLFQHLISIPWLLFSKDTGYLIFTILNILMYIASFAMIAVMLKDCIKDHAEKTTATGLIMFLVSVFLFFSLASYPFIFYVERGQSDMLILFFIVLGLFLLEKHPEKLWLQVICISIATHFKIYPALFFIPLLAAHKKKAILPIVTVNLILLFCLGPKLLINYLDFLIFKSNASINNISDWGGNHCIYSFVKSLCLGTQQTRLIWIVLSIAVAVIWAFLTYKIFSANITPIKKSLWFFIISSPVMCLIPTISNDYRLIILFPIFLIYIFFLIDHFGRSKEPVSLVALIITLLIMLYLSRSYTLPNLLLPEADTFFFRNSFLWVFFSYVLFCCEFFRIGQGSD